MGNVVTIMVGRLDDWLKEVVARDGLEVDPAALEWAGVAAFKRAYAVFGERRFRSRLLSAAFRNTLQWSELVGGDIVISPPFAWQQKIQDAGSVADADAMSRPVDPAILDVLLHPRVPRAYSDGLRDFDTSGPWRRCEELDQIVRDILIPAP
jgi:transaldolase